MFWLRVHLSVLTSHTAGILVDMHNRIRVTRLAIVCHIDHHPRNGCTRWESVASGEAQLSLYIYPKAFENEN